MALEFINAVTFQCGCRFLLAWEETRVRNGQGRLEETLPPGQERQFRIVNQAEAEDVVTSKRGHIDWAAHVVPPGQQPPPRRCPLHTAVPNSKGGYQQVVQDNNPTP